MASSRSRTSKRDPFERRAREVGRGRAAREAVMVPARVRVPVRRAEAGQRGDEDDAVARRDLARERLDLLRALDDAEPVAQPLHRRARDEGAALERVRRLARRCATRPSSPARARSRMGRVADVHEHEGAGAVGALRVALGEARLAEERRLLVARDAGDGDAVGQEAQRRACARRPRRCRRSAAGRSRARGRARSSSGSHSPRARFMSSVRDALVTSVDVDARRR